LAVGGTLAQQTAAPIKCNYNASHYALDIGGWILFLAE
jgi:hypothetical protein